MRIFNPSGGGGAGNGIGMTLGRFQGVVAFVGMPGEIGANTLRGCNRAGLAEGDVIIARGYRSAGDGAGWQLYQVRKNSSLTPNDVSVILPAGAGTPGDRFELVWDKSEINVCSAGAIADYNGSTGAGTDNAPFFALAKSVLDPVRGGDLVLPVGPYAFATPWNWGVAVRLNLVGRGSQMATEGRTGLRGSTLVWIGAAGGQMIQINKDAALTSDLLHSGPEFHRVNMISHTPQAGTGLYLRAVTGYRFVRCAARDFDVGLHLDSRDSRYGATNPGIDPGDAAWSHIESFHEYTCNRGLWVPYTAGITIGGQGKWMHRGAIGVSQEAIRIDAGPQMNVVTQKFDANDGSAGGKLILNGQFTKVHANDFENTQVVIGAGDVVGPHADDGYGNDVSHNRFRVNGHYAIRNLNAGGKVRATMLIGNSYKPAGVAGAPVENLATGAPAMYRRDALAPNG